MKTNLLKKALALVLSIMVVLTAFGGALSVFAEEAGEPEVVVDPYGTEEDGIDTTGNGIFTAIDPVIGAKNLDFAEGLKYWSTRENANGVASRVFKKYVIDGVTAYGLTNEWTGNQYDGVATVRMQLDGVKEGEKVIIAVEYMIDERLTTMAARRVLLDADVSREKRKQVIDKMAAVVILQGYMESHRDKL